MGSMALCDRLRLLPLWSRENNFSIFAYPLLPQKYEPTEQNKLKTKEIVKKTQHESDGGTSQ